MAGDAWDSRDPSVGNLLPHGHDEASLGVCFADRLVRVTSAVRRSRRREAWSERSMHSDRAMERPSARCAQSQASGGRSNQLQPADRCPAEGAINPNRQTSFRLVTGPTSTATAGLGRGRSVNSVVPAHAACGGPTSNPAAAAFPLGRPSGRTRATGITHPGFYGGKPWRKPDNTVIITGLETLCEVPSLVSAQIVQSDSHPVQQKFTSSSKNHAQRPTRFNPTTVPA